MNNYHNGHTAEKVAAEWLGSQGYKIITINWRTRFCEIDIIAQHKDCLYFVEVKYRKTLLQGHGLDYITRSKLRQMQFAAELWLVENNWEADVSLAALEVGGADYKVTNFVPDCR